MVDRLSPLGPRVASSLSMRQFNLVVSAMPGPQFRLSATAVRILTVYPVVPLSKNRVPSIGVTSYDGEGYYGFNADRNSMDDVGVLATCRKESLDELAGAVTTRGLVLDAGGVIRAGLSRRCRGSASGRRAACWRRPGARGRSPRWQRCPPCYPRAAVRWRRSGTSSTPCIPAAAGPITRPPGSSPWTTTADAGRSSVVTGRPEADLRDAVMASCAIPGWYAPIRIAGRRYVDGGTCSPTSLDLVSRLQLDEVVVLSPMTSLRYDAPTAVAAKIECRFRRLVTRRLIGEVKKVTATGTKVTLLGPGAEDLEAIGANLMDPRRWERVLATSLRTSAAALRAPSFAEAG